MPLSKEAGAGDAISSFMGRVAGRHKADGVAGALQSLFSSRGVPKNPRFLSRVNFKNMAREAVFGSPLDIYHDLKRYGKGPEGFSPAKALGNYYYRSVIPEENPRGWLNKGLRGAGIAMNVGFPALNMYMAATSPREQRGENIGHAVASLAATPFAMRMGIPGIYANRLAANAGGAIGKQFDPQPMPQQEPPQPPLYFPHTGEFSE